MKRDQEMSKSNSRHLLSASFSATQPAGIADATAKSEGIVSVHRDYGMTVISRTAWSSAPRLSVTVNTTRNTSDSL